MTEPEPLYLGFDLSTQQLKAIVTTSDLKVKHNAAFDFDKDSQGYPVTKGVFTNEAAHEVFVRLFAFLLCVTLDNGRF